MGYRMTLPEASCKKTACPHGESQAIDKASFSSQPRRAPVIVRCVAAGIEKITVHRTRGCDSHTQHLTQTCHAKA
jgi:hypothetical protein